MKQLLTTLVFFSFSSLMFIACNDKEDADHMSDIKPTFDIAGAKKVIDSLNVEFGNYVSKSDSAGLAAMYTSDAKMMGANMPSASGRSAIQSSFSGMFAQMGPIGLTLKATDVWGTEALLSEEGTYTMTKDGKEIDKGKYIVLWKMEDGKWKLHRDIFNSDLPPMAPPK
jgi:ketosteroid isomerase-like protein